MEAGDMPLQLVNCWIRGCKFLCCRGNNSCDFSVEFSCSNTFFSLFGDECAILDDVPLQIMEPIAILDGFLHVQPFLSGATQPLLRKV